LKSHFFSKATRGHGAAGGRPGRGQRAEPAARLRIRAKIDQQVVGASCGFSQLGGEHLDSSNIHLSCDFPRINVPVPSRTLGDAQFPGNWASLWVSDRILDFYGSILRVHNNSFLGVMQTIHVSSTSRERENRYADGAILTFYITI
jgi:hypothetical protein